MLQEVTLWKYDSQSWCSQLGQLNGDSNSGHRNGAESQAENDEMKPFEDNRVSDSSRDNSKSTMNTQPPLGSKARADGHTGDANLMRVRDDDAANLHSAADNFSERKKALHCLL